MRIGIDIDGVLTHYENFIEEYGTKYCYENNISMQELDFSQYDEKKLFTGQKNNIEGFGQNIYFGMLPNTQQEKVLQRC